MGYFSNGSEGSDYTERYCDSCVHDLAYRKTGNDPCLIWNMHLAHNGEKGTIGEYMEMFIPRSKDGLSNEKCRMFIPASRLDRTKRRAELEAIEGRCKEMLAEVKAGKARYE